MTRNLVEFDLCIHSVTVVRMLQFILLTLEISTMAV
jgi:hypothetical protein